MSPFVVSCVRVQINSGLSHTLASCLFLEYIQQENKLNKSVDGIKGVITKEEEEGKQTNSLII